MHALLRGGCTALLFVALAAGETQAQPIETHLPFVQNETAGTGPAGSEIAGRGNGPAIAHGIPTAYGAELGTLFGGVGFQRFLGPSLPQRNDGAAFLGAGVGDADKFVGLEVTHATYALVGDPFTEGSLSLKIHRHVYGGLSVAVGIEDLIRYGGWVSRSAYAVASHTVAFDGAVITGAAATVGIGDGRFNTMSRLSEGTNQASAFGGLSLQLADRISVLGTWYGQDLNVGVSIALPGPLPVTVTPAWISVLDKHVLGDRFALSVGTAYRFR